MLLLAVISVLLGRTDSPDATVLKIHALLAKRFESFDEGLFGLERIPTSMILHAIEPNLNDPKAFTKKFKKAAVATPEEQRLLHNLSKAGQFLEVFTYGPKGKLRGPMDGRLIFSGRDNLVAVGSKCLTSPGSGGIHEVTHNVKIRAMPIFATSPACANCHEGAKVGDKLGAVIYRYGSEATQSP